MTDTPIATTTSGTWVNGLEDHIDPERFAALRAMAGLTVDPDVLSINGRQHVINQIDNDQA